MKEPIYGLLGLLLTVIIVVAIFGYRGHHFTKPPFEIFPDMNYQDKVKDQVGSAFFADGVASRPPIAGTVAQEMPAKIDYWASGKWDETHWGDGIPVHDARDGGTALAVDDINLARGRERYAINCAICHGATGKGDGITSHYGLNGAANYHTDRIRGQSDGNLFNTITNGQGQMMGYGYNITIDDRWRIVMYIRALQRAENAALEDASPDEQSKLQEKKPKPSAMNGDSNLRSQKLVFDRHSLGDWTMRDIGQASVRPVSYVVIYSNGMPSSLHRETVADRRQIRRASPEGNR